MLINQNIHPERTIYYWGAILIESLKDTSTKSLDFFDFFAKIKKTKKDISIYAYSRTLHWLYLLGLINLKDGDIVKCF